MAVISKDLGAVTAYAAAVNRGYTGTKEEFETLMASYATVAQQAAESAQSAGQSAQSASGSATDAQTAQGTAQQAATDAQTAQASAQGYAQSAQQSAQSASQYAQSAESAKDTAVDAVDGFASGAQQALESVNSAGINWKSLAQAHALDSEAYALGTRDGEDVGTQDETYHNNAKYYAESVSASAQTASEAAQTATTKAGEASQSASQAAASAESIDPDEFNRKIYAAFATDTATGAIASFPDGADSILMKDVLVHIEPLQVGSGDPSPDNIRPITGWTGAQVTRTGKNLLRLVEAEMVAQGWNRYFPNPIKKAGQYTLSCVNSFGAPSKLGASICFVASTSDAIPIGNNLSGYEFGQTGEAQKIVTVTEDQAKAPYLCFRCGSAGCTFESISNGKIQLELGSTATDYEPYSGQTYDITFPSEAGTVYGGTLDVTKGELMVDRAMVDLGTLTYDKSSTPNNRWRFIATVPSISMNVASAKANMICSVYKTITAENTYNGVTGVSNNVSQHNIIVCDMAYSDVADFKSAMSGVQCVYPLATPITYTLTPQEIISLLGTNNLWADPGDSEVEYRADTKLYITKKITEAVSALS